jgi:hypothetical protein
MGDTKIPPAIAQGRAAQTPDAVNPLVHGIGAGILAALYLFAIFLVHPVPGRIIRLFGVPTDDVGRQGGLVMTWRPPAGADITAHEARFAAREHGARIRKSGDAFLVTVPGVAQADVADVAMRIAQGGGGLRFHEVIEAKEMQSLARLLELPMNGAKPVDVEIDQWRPDAGGDMHTDYYLSAEAREPIVAALQKAQSLGWTLPPGTHIALEQNSWNPDKPPYWRTYVLADQSELDGESISDAMGSYDPNTNRPIVLLDFDRAGAETFAELTGRIVGRKLAIVVNGEVKSAPIINSRINGGRASITMGGSDPRHEEHERDILVATLRGAGLPAGGEVVAVDWKPPGDTKPKVWSARILITVGGGLLVGLLAWAIIRALRPTRRRAPTRAVGPLPWRRIAVTLCAPLAIYIASKIPVLGIDYDELAEVAGPDAAKGLDLSFLGLTPVLTAYILIEILALSIPGWRRRRHAGADARKPLGHAVIALTFVLVLFQTWTFLKYLDALGRGMGMTELTGGDRMMMVGSFLAGVALFVGVAKLIRHHGLGNGYGVLLASGWVIGSAWPWLTFPPLLSSDHVVGGATLLVVAIPVAVAMRWRVGAVGEARLRVPTSGVSPVSDAGGLVLLLALVGSLPLPEATSDVVLDTLQVVQRHNSLAVGLVVAVTVLWSLAFARPRVTAALATRAGLSPVSSRTFWRATALSAALLLFLLGPALLRGYSVSFYNVLLNPLSIGALAALGLDIVDDLHVRRVSLEIAWSLQQAQHADLVAHDLESAGIPCHLASSNLRTLFAFFAPFVPIDVLVPAEHVPAARVRIAALLAP